ncbi:MAG: pseudouridine synthase [Patescibacteria group bacterium]|mgnify:CR=1 FL=1
MRVQKYLSEQGILSRRKAEEYIRAGKILINGEVAKIGAKIDPAKDKVEVAGGTDNFETVAINKPRGIVSSKITKEGKTVFELFPRFNHLHITGRLDKESEGLMILTNDGVLAKKITGKEHSIEKEYRVSVREDVQDTQLRAMAAGLRLRDGITLPAKTRRLGRHEFSLTLKEGRNHQIRRMADKIHLTVTRLIRVRIGTINLAGLKEGNARVLSKKEVDSFKRS